ncbi:MAG TPA: hypothetical protein VHX37_11195 [Acidobacteriaceae bacterium]|nr:hypothetical protein [Acidobacteriaceae bacterium]
MTTELCPGAPRPRRIVPGSAFLLVFLLALLVTPLLHAQGCIVARSPEQVIPGLEGKLPTNQGGYLLPGHFQLTIGERHQFSYQHYVGDVYQEYRAQQHTQVENRINLMAFDLLYQATPRVSLEFNAPLLFASRKSQNSPIEYQAQGFGDIILAVNSWILSPAAQHKGNLSLGIGVLMPTGNDDVQNTVNTNTSGTGPAVEVTAPVDYSIQPGNGGWGMATQWQGFRQIGRRFILYTDGDYIASQGGTNGVQRSATLSTTQPLNNYDARSDQYLLEAGAAIPIPALRGLALTVGPRDEGVPAHNLFPNSNDGFRRPGFAVSAGPGFEYTHGNSILTAAVDKAIHRDRTVSVPDQAYGAHGDAAFATTLWLATYTYRF